MTKVNHYIPLVLLVFSSAMFAWSTVHCTTIQEGEGYVFSHDGVRLFYRVVGNGPDTLIVLHGGPGNTMESILPDLRPLEQNHTVIYYDQRGNGRSDLLFDDNDLAISHHIKDLEAIRLHFNLQQITLLGNSWGGLLASFYAVAHPDRVERMVLLSPASPSFKLLEASTNHIHMRIPENSKEKFNMLTNPDKWLTSQNPRQICRMFYDILIPVYFTDTTKSKDMRGDTCAGPIDALKRQQIVNKQIWHSLGRWDIQRDLQNVNAPILIIHGRDDMISLESSLAWTKAYPDARLLIIENSGHMAHIEQPEIFFEAIDIFLKGNWPDRVLQPNEQIPR